MSRTAIPKSYRPISHLCHTYKLYERMIPNRIAQTIEQHLIKEHAVSDLVRHAQANCFKTHIEDGYHESMIPGTDCVDLSAAYKTVTHRFLIQKHFNIMQDSTLCRVIHPSKKPLEVKKGLHDKCETILLPCKCRTM